MFGKALDLINGAYGKLIIWGAISLIILISLGFVYHKFTSLIAENATLKFNNAQYQININDKNKEIADLKFSIELKEKLIDENLETIQKREDEIESFTEELSKRDDGKNDSSEYMKEFMRHFGSQK